MKIKFPTSTLEVLIVIVPLLLIPTKVKEDDCVNDVAVPIIFVVKLIRLSCRKLIVELLKYITEIL